MPDPAQQSPLLIPRPARLDLRGGRVEAASAPRVVRDRSLPDGGYRLTVRSGRIEIAGGIGAGIEHAQRTLGQLRTQYGSHVPRCTIEDAPAFAARGVMLDISRDRVPTMAHLFRLADHLAALKFNHLQLYTEHTFAYRGHDGVWCDPVTPAEIIELDTYCRTRGIELAANQNCFGHLASWLRRPEYAHLAETHGEWEFEYGGERFPRTGPFSLCPTDPASLEFVAGLLGQLLPCFTSGLVNIGCDETFDVGAGRSAAAVRERGRTAVCMEFIRKVGDRARALGKRPQFWTDIALHNPGAAGILGDAIALVWDYEPGYGWSDACARLSDAGREVWVCPGTSAWRSITGRTSERRANLAEAAAQGAAAGATGFLVTEWGDTGHHQQWPITLHALAEAADAAWTGGRGGYDPRAAALHIFGDRSLGLGAWLDELGDADLPLRDVCGRRGEESGPKRLRNSSALFVDLHTPLADSPTVDARVRRGILSAPAHGWEAVLDRLRTLERDGRWHSSPEGEITDELRHTLDAAIFAAVRAVLRRTPCGEVSRGELAGRLGGLMAEHERLWLRRSRPGGLASSNEHYRRVLDDLRGAAAGGAR